MKKSIPFSILIILLSVFTFAQEVISSSGDYYSNASGSISFTIGEPITETVSSTNNALTQGFQQSAWWFVGVEKKDNALQVDVFPNPTRGELNIRFPKTTTNQYLLKLVSIDGKVVLSKQIELSENLHHMQLHSMPSTIYYLQVISDNQLIKQVPVSKIK
jgi:hypothetical protein